MSIGVAESIVILGSFAESLTRFRGSLIAALVARGHRVVACAPDASDEVRRTLAVIGAEYRDIRLSRAGLNPLSDMRFLMQVERLLKRERATVLFAYTIKPVVYGGLAARLVGRTRFVPMITGVGFGLTAGQGLARSAVGGLVRILYRFALRRAHVVFFQNPDDLALFRNLSLVKPAQACVQVPGSGIDIDEFPYSQPPPTPTFLMIARLLRDKGVVEYVEAARLVRARHPEARFQLAGWIDENPTSITESELKRWVEGGDIEFLGRLSDVRPALRACSVYVLPSYREGTPRTVLEALAIGRAVVTTDAPGCRETVRDGVNGYLVPVRDSKALAQRLCELLESPEQIRAFGMASRRLAEEKFDVRIVNRILIEGVEAS
jgi:glycosyltransferase involved in cell wall biosynthesis